MHFPQFRILRLGDIEICRDILLLTRDLEVPENPIRSIIMRSQYFNPKGKLSSLDNLVLDIQARPISFKSCSERCLRFPFIGIFTRFPLHVAKYVSLATAVKCPPIGF